VAIRFSLLAPAPVAIHSALLWSRRDFYTRAVHIRASKPLAGSMCFRTQR
jgi:hypothetical protein